MSMFTRRHYVWLASAAREMLNADLSDHCDNDSYIADLTIKAAINVFADALEGESPGFNKTRFLNAVFSPGFKQATCAKCGESIRETAPGVWRDISSSDLCPDDPSQVHNPAN